MSQKALNRILASPRWRTSLAGFCLLTANLALAQPSPHSDHVSTPHSINIPAQPLDQALTQLTEQTGVTLAIQANDLPTTMSPALKGRMGLEDALKLLLSNSLLQARITPEGHVLITDAPDQAMVMPPVLVLGHDQQLGMTVYDREHIRSMPGRHGQITELLRQNPAVQFDRNSRSSKNPADLASENISINGAKYWDNNFSVDGVSINNDLNPGGQSVTANSSMTDLPANTSQGMNLDTSLLESITVYDSNVPAEYGGFTGGVVEADTRTPTRELSGSVSMSLTQDSWTEYHLDDRYEEDFHAPSDADGTAETQPNFRTLTYRATLEGYLTDDFGLIGSFVRRTSNIYDKNIYASNFVDNGVTAPSKTDLTQQVDNLFLKGVWAVNDRLNLSSTLNYAPQSAEYFNINTLNGGFDIESGGLQTTLKADWQGDWGTWQHGLNYSSLEQSRQNGEDYFKAWYASADKNWSDPTQRWNATMEGSYGNIEQTQDKFGYDFKLQLLPLQTGAAEHSFNLGGNVEHTAATYGRTTEFTQANGTDLIPTYTCQTASGDIDDAFCSATPIIATPYRGWAPDAGQMFKRLYHYVPGEIKVSQTAVGAFVDDRIQWHNLSVRTGIRAEWDDYLRNVNIAPRLALNWDLFGDQQTRVIAGANRYYGRSIFDYRLREQRESMRYFSLRDPNTLEFGERILAAKNSTHLQDLKTPYDDEVTLGIEQVFADTLFSLRVVDRKGRDQIHRERISNDGSHEDLATTYYTYTNDGTTDSKNYYVSIRPQGTLNLWHTFTQGELTLGWSDVTTTGSHYNQNLDDTLVMYKGSPIKTYDIPVDNYTRPWTVGLTTKTHIPAAGLTLANFFNWRSSYSQVIRDGRIDYQGQRIYNYVDYDIDAALTWDMRVGWQKAVGSNETLFANLDIGNVLNDKNTIGSSSSSSTSAEIDYELGRNFTLEVGYRF
ncbi:TonB-dependent receptor plug domain-containing protein [Marinobacterium marinum]|uniref:TonB-dependent receptor plug domain-containing protein n=1 Tax=Marinobacterium marinum TaxID=2756129 RepID=A0A7W1WXY6_9GAMM|nr:TonB-dependent receptor plug domain-containing protein [Marinobacterium marinum]MBA4502299.1 TonB-dependent receptor plug domain-containing protein [Marinobacterium marinum]